LTSFNKTRYQDELISWSVYIGDSTVSSIRRETIFFFSFKSSHQASCIRGRQVNKKKFELGRREAKSHTVTRKVKTFLFIIWQNKFFFWRASYFFHIYILSRTNMAILLWSYIFESFSTAILDFLIHLTFVILPWVFTLFTSVLCTIYMFI